ncbi:MAG: hypothetical protein JO112_09180 [Planctomycetes bacterium]|nr:hypothetical protein [Planctomycetota bacterium]
MVSLMSSRAIPVLWLPALVLFLAGGRLPAQCQGGHHIRPPQSNSLPMGRPQLPINPLLTSLPQQPVNPLLTPGQQQIALQTALRQQRMALRTALRQANTMLVALQQNSLADPTTLLAALQQQAALQTALQQTNALLTTLQQNNQTSPSQSPYLLPQQTAANISILGR